jgi:hypothetical protein
MPKEGFSKRFSNDERCGIPVPVFEIDNELDDLLEQIQGRWIIEREGSEELLRRSRNSVKSTARRSIEPAGLFA